MTTIFESLNKLITRIDQCELTSKNDILMINMPKIRKILAANHEDFSNYSPDETSIILLKKIRSYNDDYLMFAEKNESVRIFDRANNSTCINGEIFDHDLSCRYQRKKKEIPKKYIPITGKACVVGAGSLPDTMLFLLKNSNDLLVDGLDIDTEATMLGNKLLSTTKNRNKAKIFKINGMDHDYSKYDFIYVEGFVRPKNKTVKRIIESASSNTLILVDNPVGYFTKIYEEVDTKSFNNISLVDKTNSNAKLGTYYSSEIIIFKK